MRYNILSLGLLFANTLAVPTSSKTTPSCDSIAYASFEGSVCGIVVFKGFTDETITVETVGDGIFGLEAFSGPFPYHGTPRHWHKLI